MNNKQILSIIKKLKKTWKSSMIQISNIRESYYSNGGYYITIVDIVYNNKRYQLNHDLNDSIIFSL